MIILEILVITFSVLFPITIFISYLYKKKKGLPTGECAMCKKGTNKLIKQYHKMYKKEEN